MFRMIVTAALLTVSSAALAQQAPAATASSATTSSADTSSADAQAATGKPPQRIRSVMLTGAEACPKGAGDEIVVCSRINPDEQYRVPKQFRDQPKVDAASQSWVNRTATIDEVGRVAGGLPDTCSAIGSGGQTGCTAKFLQDYAAEKAQKKRDDSSIP